MKLYRNRKAQSLIEYAILLAVVIAAFMLLQGVIKRGVSGSGYEAATRMGEQYAVGGTTTYEDRTKTGDTTIIEESGSDETLADFLEGTPLADVDPTETLASGAHTFSTRQGDEYTTTSESKSISLADEKYRWDDLESTEVEDFTLGE